MKKREIETKEISGIIKTPSIGHNIIINGLNLCNRESEFSSIVSFINSEKFIQFVKDNSKIKAIFLTDKLYDILKNDRPDLVYYISPNPDELFYKLHIALFESKIFYDQFNFEPIIGHNCSISSRAIVENGVIIGDNVKICDLSVVKRGSVIGNNSYIGYGTIIGSEGFQDVKINNINTLIPHVGGCTIGNNVTIFDNTCVCNSLFEDTTVIGDHTKIDNLVHIAHNCIIGSNCTITAGTILCGSTTMEDSVWLAPNTSVLNKVRLKENSMVGLGAVVLKDVESGDVVVGNPAKSIRNFK